MIGPVEIIRETLPTITKIKSFKIFENINNFTSHATIRVNRSL